MDANEAGGWAAGVSGFLAVGYAVIRFVRHLLRQYRADQEESDQAQEQKEVRRRREAAQEAWEVVDMKQEELDRLYKRMDEVEKKAEAAMEKVKEEREKADAERRRCERDLAYIRGRLEMVEMFAVSKGLKLPPAPPMDGSGHHRPTEG